ncbi:MAG: xanthine dehydrogenase family protein molybdopterin-binding subunit [Candidatus Solibacter usitatus]|nr:xanthine dehydrogenase family protein molybdopterin-binding subunit [Candidatus Solibacter usitatus]
MKPVNGSSNLNLSTWTPDAVQAFEKAGFSRRGFLRGAGALIVGFMAGGEKLAAQATGTRVTDGTQVDTWVAIAQDESVVAYSGKCEFGQGFLTVQHQLVADELNVPYERVKVIICDTALTPDQGTTSGSQSHPAEFGTAGLRQALATAREQMFRMAATRLSLTPDQLMVKDGVIMSKTDSTKRVTYGQLIGGSTFKLTLDTKAIPKDAATYTVLGTSVPRVDIPGKVFGKHQYVQNVRVPGMLHGKPVRPPTIGAKVVSVNEASVKGLPGNVKVVVKNDFVGVVADREWQALQASKELDVTWSDGPAIPDQATLYDYMRKQPTRDSLIVNASDVDRNLAAAARQFKATYLHPYQIHGSMGSSCAVADVQGTGATATATIWSSTQGVYPQRDSAALLLGLPRPNVRVVFVEGSGCYGINGADTVCYDAALMSQAVGKPVRVQYTRADEMTDGENIGPAFVVDLTAGVDDKGQIIAWDYESWALSKGGRPNATTPGNIITAALAGFPTPAIVPAAANSPTTFGNNGNAASSYGAGVVGNNAPGGTGNVRSERVKTHTIQSMFFTGPLRSPNRLQNTFANESFIDEIAAAVKVDPVQYRLRHLSDARLIDVLNAAAKAANWDTRVSPKPGNAKTGVVTGRGISCVLYEGDNGYCAIVAEVEVDQDSGVMNVKRLIASQDSGAISNPDGMRNQMEGGALQGMSRAMKEEVKWSGNRITSVDWVRFPVFKFGDALPVVETVIVNRTDKLQMGAGECTITSVAAAIANALYDATGARLRQVPFTPARVLAALKERA